MINAIQQPWVEQGYKTFSEHGPHALKVERLAKDVGKNKSSFYHHFADLEVFLGLLLDYHLHRAELIAVKESNSKNQEELISILLEHETDILFNKQLRVNRTHPGFEKCFIKTNEIIFLAIINVWSQIIGLKENSYLAGLVLRLSLENFFLQITADTLNENWLRNYFHELKSLVSEFKKLGNSATLNGSV